MRGTKNTFSILALAAGILLIVLEINTFRRIGEVAWFWLLIAGLMIALGVAGLFDKPRGK